MNLADPELELIDPTPNVHILFVHFDQTFFWTRLASRAAVRWSKRMYSCAGICSYDRGGLCDIALSEPLLKLRPRKDLVETLLHEMIHAYLFVTNKDQDRDGHGPNFQAQMYRINAEAGLNISIYHDFHDEVELYKTHWWRCNGPCQTRRPHFGIVRRSANRAPGPKDFWWNDHRLKCGGTFVKIKEPEKKGKAKAKTDNPMADITKYITIENSKIIKTPPVKPVPINPQKNPNNKINHNGNLSAFHNPQQNISKVFGDKGQSVSKIENNYKSVSVADTVRNIWANKTIPGVATSSPLPVKRNISALTPKKHVTSPPAKMKKIDDYFIKASSVLKDVYGEDFELATSDKNNKIVIVGNTSKPDCKFVDCPICSVKVLETNINKHVDECLNSEIIEQLNSPNTSHISQTVGASDLSINNNSIANGQKCACCNEIIDKPMDQHLDECLAFFDNNTTVPTEAAAMETIVIDDDDDILNESQLLNDTGTKYPCPCCLQLIEETAMNNHLDTCLG